MKYALFTGATGGIGTLCLNAISKTGNWTVFAAGTNQDALTQLGKLPRIIPITMDVTSQESVENAYQVVKSSTLKLDAILNFAGIPYFTSMIEGDGIEAVDKLLQVNVLGTVRVNYVFFDLVKKAEGRIINCSSESGWMTPQPFAGPYILSKYAIEAYNDSLRRELIYHKIPVIKIQPGAYKTQLSDKIYRYFDHAIEHTMYYKKLLIKMKPMMDMEMQQNNNPEKLVKTVQKAMNAPHPKRRYRVGTGKLLLILEFFPEGFVDFIYKMIYKKA